MAENDAYAAHFPSLRPWAARLYRFRSPALLGFRLQREPRRWRVVGEEASRALAAERDRKKRWRYEGPGVWSAPVGPLRALWWRARLR